MRLADMLLPDQHRHTRLRMPIASQHCTKSSITYLLARGALGARQLAGRPVSSLLRAGLQWVRESADMLCLSGG